jgi:hypothetical protein
MRLVVTVAHWLEEVAPEIVERLPDCVVVAHALGSLSRIGAPSALDSLQPPQQSGLRFCCLHLRLDALKWHTVKQHQQNAHLLRREDDPYGWRALRGRLPARTTINIFVYIWHDPLLLKCG